MKKIVFEVVNEEMRLATEQPIPAVTALPQWYKSMESFYKSRKIEIDEEGPRSTAKTCVPMRDAMTAGYFVLLNIDVLVSDSENGKVLSWPANIDVASRHDSRQVEGMPVPVGFSPKPFKWINTMNITTPKGYSCLLSHPINRPDLPFYTLSGIVDTDTFDLPINFPFYIRNDFTGVIPAGTPIAQVIPMKRDSWQSTFIRLSDSSMRMKMSMLRLNKKFFGAYSKFFWVRKEYK